ncbi:MAG: DUF4440 domain-containing protein [Phaeodactylibacter sp.]|nr:DUF4440 domain-containing protein [Phaeodactylibacter sp.]
MRQLIAFTILVFVLTPLSAQKINGEVENGKEALTIGVIKEIQSKALSEKRILNIYLPEGYNPDSAATYPVIYLLDGSAHEDLPHIAGLVQFMNMYELMPKSIVVGIANVDRYRDFTHPTTDPEDLNALPTGGGSGKFIDFIGQELQPFIEKNYKTTGTRTIIGQSMGGLLATEILLKKPHLFDDYIIVSPSLWWDRQSLVNSADSILRANPGLEKKVFVSLGEEHPVMHDVADKLVSAIRNSGNENIRLFYEPILDEDHATILHAAVYKAFKMMNGRERLLREFQRQTERWRLAYNSGEAHNLAPLYSEGARYLSSHVPGLEANGREAVIANFQKGMDMGGHIGSIEILTMDISDGLATLLCKYQATNRGETVEGRNLLILKKMNGAWLIVLHMTVV